MKQQNLPLDKIISTSVFKMNVKCRDSLNEVDLTRDDCLIKDDLDFSISCDTVSLITEVEKRPEIYDHSKIEYADRKVRARAWNEICEIVVPNWSSLSKENKHAEGKNSLLRIYFVYIVCSLTA